MTKVNEITTPSIRERITDNKTIEIKIIKNIILIFFLKFNNFVCNKIIKNNVYVDGIMARLTPSLFTLISLRNIVSNKKSRIPKTHKRRVK